MSTAMEPIRTVQIREWVLVKDRLPKAGTKVLVLSNSGEMEVLHRQGTGWYPGGLDIGNTRAWMPLPEPPR
jgi:hypothetical protein